jgi:hypothetical protein
MEINDRKWIIELYQFINLHVFFRFFIGKESCVQGQSLNGEMLLMMLSGSLPYG